MISTEKYIKWLMIITFILGIIALSPIGELTINDLIGLAGVQ